ncbi:hypothetical protein [Longispora urticae]
MTSPFPAIVEKSALGPLAESITGANAGGESLAIRPLVTHPELYAKLYNPQRLVRADIGTLDRLVAFPDTLTVTDRTRLRRRTSWPVSRIVERGVTVGVLIPRAPQELITQVKSRVSDKIEVRRVDMDLLAQPDAYLLGRGLPPQGLHGRLAIARRLASIGAILERGGIVYADWSYTNAFWGPKDQSAFLIDLDCCSFGPRGHVLTPGFEDPLTPKGVPVDNATDRYRLALLVSRCVTGCRTLPDVLGALLKPPSEAFAPAYDTLRGILLATDRRRRTSLTELCRALSAAGSGQRVSPPTSGSRTRRPAQAPASGGAPPDNVTGWRPRNPPPARPAPPPPARPAPPPPRVRLPPPPAPAPVFPLRRPSQSGRTPTPPAPAAPAPQRPTTPRTGAAASQATTKTSFLSRLRRFFSG